MTIKAIETSYAGCRFRSRLEARWAVFFDTLGIEWEYEPQGFEGPHGRYLPDFVLPGALRHSRNWCHSSPNEVGCVDCGGPIWRDVYVEVKGSTESVSDADRARYGSLIDFGGPLSDGLLLLGPVPRPSAHYIGHQVARNVKGVAVYEASFVEVDGRVRLYETVECGLGMPTDTLPKGATWSAHITPGTSLQPRVSAAYAKAKSARFEHGERG